MGIPAGAEAVIVAIHMRILLTYVVIIDICNYDP